MLKHPLYDVLSVVGEAYRHVFVIRNTILHKHSWYFHNLRMEELINGVIWTPHLSQAYVFPSEELVEEFKMKYITPRKVEILRIEKELV